MNRKQGEQGRGTGGKGAQERWWRGGRSPWSPCMPSSMALSLLLPVGRHPMRLECQPPPRRPLSHPCLCPLRCHSVMTACPPSLVESTQLNTRRASADSGRHLTFFCYICFWDSAGLYFFLDTYPAATSPLSSLCSCSFSRVILSFGTVNGKALDHRCCSGCHLRVLEERVDAYCLVSWENVPRDSRQLSEGPGLAWGEVGGVVLAHVPFCPGSLVAV